MTFEWDSDKNESNIRKHGVSFDETKELFTSGTDFLEIHDEEHSEKEDRFIAIGPIEAGIVVVSYTERPDDVIRLISARLATKTEIELFQNYSEGIHD